MTLNLRTTRRNYHSNRMIFFSRNNIQSNLSVVDNILHENLERIFWIHRDRTLFSLLPNKHQHADSVAESMLHTPEFLHITLLHNVVAEIFKTMDHQRIEILRWDCSHC